MKPFDWAIVQLRTGFRQRSKVVVPPVELPGCAGGTVSTRHWLNWRQANSVTAFGIQFLRTAATLVEQKGAVPLGSWIEQSWSGRAGAPNRKQSFMDPHGDLNCAVLISSVSYRPSDLTREDFFGRVLPAVVAAMPYEMKLDVDPRGEYVVHPYQSMIELGPVWHVPTSRYLDDRHAITLTSPYYYCGYRTARAPVAMESWHWPLDPAQEHEPLIDPRPPRGTLKRGDLPRHTEAVLKDMRSWGERLGFIVGPETFRGWSTDGNGFRRYKLTAPVELLVDPEELYRRAQPYRGRVNVNSGSRVSKAAHIRSSAKLISFGGYSEMLVGITDPDADGKFVLTIDGPSF